MKKLLRVARLFEFKLAINKVSGPQTDAADAEIDEEEQLRQEANKSYEQNKPFVQDAATHFLQTNKSLAYAKVMIEAEKEKFFPQYLIITTADPKTKAGLLSDLQGKFPKFIFELV